MVHGKCDLVLWTAPFLVQQSMGVHHPNSGGHTTKVEAITQTQSATPKHENPSIEISGLYQSVGVHNPHSRGEPRKEKYMG